ncbi:MAG: phage tail protein I [Geobacteraceae bacterium]|nr:phage tail protein I [Geobacteraceae bacterium]
MADERLIPGGLRNDDSAYAYNEMAERLGAMDLTPLLVYIVDNVDASVLPYLAEQFHVTGYEGWRQAKNDAERRALLKNAREMHRYKGTEYALELAINSLGLTFTVLKWWEYSGLPYHFKISFDLLDSGITADEQTLLTALVNEYKAKRDVLDNMEFNLAISGDVFVGISCQSSEIITVYPE